MTNVSATKISRIEKRKPTLVGPESWGRKLYVAMKSFRPATSLTRFDWVDPADYFGPDDLIDYLPVRATNFLLGDDMRRYFNAQPIWYDAQTIHGRSFRLLPYPDNENKLKVAKCLLMELDRW